MAIFNLKSKKVVTEQQTVAMMVTEFNLVMSSNTGKNGLAFKGQDTETGEELNFTIWGQLDTVAYILELYSSDIKEKGETAVPGTVINITISPNPKNPSLPNYNLALPSGSNEVNSDK